MIMLSVRNKNLALITIMLSVRNKNINNTIIQQNIDYKAVFGMTHTKLTEMNVFQHYNNTYSIQ